MKSSCKQILFSFSLLAFCYQNPANAQQSPIPINQNPITTPWAAQVDKSLPLPEYPRPQMVRSSWMNLNGIWEYAILKKNSARPVDFQGDILVPFPVESHLSDVTKAVGAENQLWYKKSMDLKNQFKKGRTLLHFGAVDWEAEVFVNGISVGIHQGGYDPFSFDITSQLKRSGKQEIMVRVWDPSDQGPQPRGKQVNKPGSIWYTPVTGIWQTVWLENVPETYISNLKITPDWDNDQFRIQTDLEGGATNQKVQIKVLEGGKVLAETTGDAGKELVLKIADPKSWSPENPFLYDLEINLLQGNKIIDQVESYAALRKISMVKDAQGFLRMQLNDEVSFQYGPLDQGWWPDGLYTAPTDEALAFDIIKTKEMGFNMIRKHVKVEPARWYFHCDRLGIMVWQDMPSGDMGNNWESRPGIIGKGTDKERSPESEKTFKQEWKAIMDANHHFPSIVVWVPFNEAWGQFKTREITEWTKNYDPSRLVNSASGGNFEMEGAKITGDIFDIHNYPDPVMPDPGIYGKIQILVLGEFGGLGLPIEGHTWQEKDNWGYQSFKSEAELRQRYEKLMVDLAKLIPKGLAAAVYTQTTDVEVETNGLMTYDRKVIKIPVEVLKRLHQPLYQK